jgi:hypothetical protein
VTGEFEEFRLKSSPKAKPFSPHYLPFKPFRRDWLEWLAKELGRKVK